MLRSEGYLLRMSQTTEARAAMRTRSYSTNDSDELEEKLQERPRRISFSEYILGRRSLFSSNQPVVNQTVLEESISAQSLAEPDGLSMSTDSHQESQDTVTDQSGMEQQPARETTQTDHLNKRLLDSFLSRLGNFAGVLTPGTVYHSEHANENEIQESGDYSTVYSDDLLMDRIYRRMNSKNGHKK